MAANLVGAPPVAQKWWKRVAVISFFGGAGFALAVATIIGIWAWYSSRPKPPRPWDAKSLTATFDNVRVEGKENHLVFYYTVENHTDADYSLDSSSDVHTSAKLEHTDSYLLFGRTTGLRLPVFIPAHKRVQFPLEISNFYPKPEDADVTPEQKKEFRDAVKKYVNSELPNLDGFSVFDQSSRYEIDFPPGWKSKK